MTIAMLLRNTLAAARLAADQAECVTAGTEWQPVRGVPARCGRSAKAGSDTGRSHVHPPGQRRWRPAEPGDRLRGAGELSDIEERMPRRRTARHVAEPTRGVEVNLEQVQREDWIVGGLALALAIFLLILPWFDLSVGPFSATFSATSAPDGWLGILAFIASLAVIADLAIERLSPQTQIPMLQPRQYAVHPGARCCRIRAAEVPVPHPLQLFRLGFLCDRRRHCRAGLLRAAGPQRRRARGPRPAVLAAGRVGTGPAGGPPARPPPPSDPPSGSTPPPAR